MRIYCYSSQDVSALNIQASLTLYFSGLTIASLKNESLCILLHTDREEKHLFFRAEWVSQIEEFLSSCKAAGVVRQFERVQKIAERWDAISLFPGSDCLLKTGVDMTIC